MCLQRMESIFTTCESSFQEKQKARDDALQALDSQRASVSSKAAMGRDAARVDWEALSSSARESALEDNSVTQQVNSSARLPWPPLPRERALFAAGGSDGARGHLRRRLCGVRAPHQWLLNVSLPASHSSRPLPSRDHFQPPFHDHTI